MSRRLPACARGEEGELIVGRLRQGIDADRSWLSICTGVAAAAPKLLVAPVKVTWNSVLIAARAEIGIDPPQLRRRILAPAGVVDGVGGDVAGQVADLAAGLHRSADAAERAGR